MGVCSFILESLLDCGWVCIKKKEWKWIDSTTYKIRNVVPGLSSFDDSPPLGLPTFQVGHDIYAA